MMVHLNFRERVGIVNKEEITIYVVFNVINITEDEEAVIKAGNVIDFVINLVDKVLHVENSVALDHIDLFIKLHNVGVNSTIKIDVRVMVNVVYLVLYVDGIVSDKDTNNVVEERMDIVVENFIQMEVN